MKVLMAHNIHLIPGGEDESFAQESQLLRDNGHQVIPYLRNNNLINQIPLWQVSLRSLWSFEDYRAMRQVIQLHQPDILHIQNTFPLISPAIFYAAHREGIPTVMSLRNYRLYCLNSYFFRDNRVCEDCIRQPIPISGIHHRCYRHSLSGSLVTASMLSFHRMLRTYQRYVDMFIALTQFAFDKFSSHGIPLEKIKIKPNFVYPDPQIGPGGNQFVVYVGRLSPEKGINILLEAWRQLGTHIQLKIAGSGPLQEKVQAVAAHNPAIEYLGRKPIDQIYDLLGKAQALIFPSQWYEGMPRTIIEAFAKGTPVIASRLGAMESMVKPGHTGLHFNPGDVDDLVEKVSWMLQHQEQWNGMRCYARQEYMTHYTAENNYFNLLKIYKKAQKNSHKSSDCYLNGVE